MPDGPVSYTPIEVRGYLPGGWSLVETGGRPEANQGDGWIATVIDTADMEWSLTVLPRDVEKHGRQGALRHAIDRIYREALG